MEQKILKPADPARSQYTIEPGLLKMRGIDLPGMTSISFRELLPGIPSPLFPGDQGIDGIRKAVRVSLAPINMEKIKKGDSG